MKTIKELLGGLAAAAIIVATSSNAFGVATITISGHNDYRSGIGGEFNVRAVNQEGMDLIGNVFDRGYISILNTTMGAANGTAMSSGIYGLGFETFCIEYNEHITLPGTYSAAISLGAIYGGVDGGIDPDGTGPLPQTDLISVGTAYLYNNFAKGLLTDTLVGFGIGSGYDYANGPARAADAVKLQNAIWFLEDEISYANAGGLTNPFLKHVLSVYTGTSTSLVGNTAGGAKVDNTIWKVAALNLGGVAPNQKQDQLILSVPDGGTTVMLLGFSLSGLAYLRRKLA